MKILSITTFLCFLAGLAFANPGAMMMSSKAVIPPAVITLDDSAFGSSFSAASTVTNADDPVDLKVGDIVVVFVRNADTKNVTGVTDDASTPNTYAHIVDADTGIGEIMEAWHTKVTTAKTGATITATFEDALASYRSIQIFVVSGLAGGTLDQYNIGNGTFQTDLSSVGSITTTTANEFVVGAWANRNSNPATVTGDWTKGPSPPVPGTSEYSSSEYQIVSGTGTYSLGATFTSQAVAGIICSFD